MARGRTWKLRQLKYRHEWPPPSAPLGEPGMDPEVRKQAAKMLHREWVEAYADPVMSKAREVFIHQGRGAVCVSFADMNASLDGLDLQATIMPRHEVLDAVAQAAPERLNPVREMLDTYDPGNQFVLVMFDDIGDLYPYRICVEPPDPTEVTRITIRVPGGRPLEEDESDDESMPFTDDMDPDDDD